LETEPDCSDGKLCYGMGYTFGQEKSLYRAGARVVELIDRYLDTSYKLPDKWMNAMLEQIRFNDEQECKPLIVENKNG
jgi:hypothetical protein